MGLSALQECKLKQGGDGVLFIQQPATYIQPLNLSSDLLFGRNVAVTYGGAIHFGHLHIALDLSELQSQVLTTDSHECAAFPGTPERGDLLKLESRLITLEMWICLFS